jgi:Ca2+-binding EF-hand superfamily protein
MSVFISHSSHDKAVADATCAALEQAGLQCWIAPRNITPGADWGGAIIEGIEQSRVFVLVFTDHANRSPQVLREVERAVAKGIPVIPFRVEKVAPTKGLEYFISAQHWMDAFPPPLDRHLEKLTNTAKHLLESSAAVESVTGTPAMPTGTAHSPPRAKGRQPVARLVFIAVGIVGLLLATIGLAVFARKQDSAHQQQSQPPQPPGNATGVGTYPSDKAVPSAEDLARHDPTYERILRERFALGDKDADDHLSSAELRQVISRMRLRNAPASELQGVFGHLDKNNDDRLTAEELLAFAEGLVALRDQDRDGQLTVAEHVSGGSEPGKPASKKVALTVFRNRDRNGDGLITVRETEQALAIDWLTPDK